MNSQFLERKQPEREPHQMLMLRATTKFWETVSRKKVKLYADSLLLVSELLQKIWTEL